MLKWQGWHVGSERVRRLYREEGLSLRLRPKRRRKVASHLRVVAPPPQRPRERRSMDFMVDSFIDGRRFRVLTVVDIFSRHSPIIEADTSLNGTKVVAALERAAKRFGYPQVMQVDNVLNASLLSSKSDSHPRRLAGAFDAIKTVHTTVNQWSSAVVGSLA
jgi:putative transposase